MRRKSIKQWFKLLGMTGPIPREEWAIVKVLYSDKPGPYESHRKSRTRWKRSSGNAMHMTSLNTSG